MSMTRDEAIAWLKRQQRPDVHWSAEAQKHWGCPAHTDSEAAAYCLRAIAGDEAGRKLAERLKTAKEYVYAPDVDGALSEYDAALAAVEKEQPT